VNKAIGMDACFCDPHSPWQRGSIENGNARIRRDLPRKASLGNYTDADIDDVIWNLVLCRTQLPCEREPLLGILIVPGGGGEWIVGTWVTMDRC
jgi:hypothetical protein